MKKLLSMALMLIMVFSLFAVPAMALTVELEMIADGGFENTAAGTALGSTSSATAFRTAGSYTTASVVNIAAEGITANGNSVNALRINNTTAGKAPEIRTSTFDINANKVYKLSFDYLIKEESATAVNCYGLGCLSGSGTAQKIYYSADGTTWKATTDTINYFDPASETNTVEGTEVKTYITDVWATYEVYFKFDSNLSAYNFKILPYNAFTADDEAGVVWYLDNVSVTADFDVVGITVTEANDYGTVKTPQYVPTDGTATITVEPDFGYYLHSATLNGTDITESFAVNYVAGAGAKQYYTYTLNGASISGDAELVITYGQYNIEELVIGGNAQLAEGYNVTTKSACTITVDNTVGNGDTSSYKVIGTDNTPELRLPAFDVVADEFYYMAADIKIPTAGDVRLDANSTWGKIQDTATGELWYKSFTYTDDASWQTFGAYIKTHGELGNTYATLKTLDVTADDSGNCAVYFDNVSFVRLTEGGVPSAPLPTEYDVVGTTNNEAYGTVAASAATSEGEAVTFTVTPKLGYYVAAATLNGESVLGSFDAYEGGTYTVAEVAEDVELAVEFAAVAAKGENVATLTDSFVAADTAVTFGKVLDTTDATSWGIELKKDGVGVTPYHGGSYLYKALATNANGQYAIEFIGLEAGEYTIRSYVYVNGTATFGAPSTFVVE